MYSNHSAQHLKFLLFFLGITHNLCNGDLSLLPDNVQALVGESIKLALHENVFDSMSVLLNLIEGNSLEGMEEEADRDKHIDSVFESIDFHLSAQSSALILLANLCCSSKFLNYLFSSFDD